ncbi:hypothetical protein [Mycobacterium marseillense]|uniref:hypothetical protein n=1 Tax=Mycobacterium marseillense TaxID=701042 RepID=UPI0012FDA5D7|nr:hypothetical protein [Mycobacterium marseillense]
MPGEIVIITAAREIRNKMPSGGHVRPTPPDFVVPYSALRFPPGLINWNDTLRFTEADLAHALFVTGRAPGDQARYGALSVWEFLHRTTLIPAYVRRRPYGELVRSELVQLLDRSELVGVSYALGMALTAIFCRIQLGATYLMHADRYADQYQLVFNATTRRRADLIGPTANGWIVAEAKGRSRTPEAALRTRMEEQKRSVISVQGQTPWLTLGCVAYFPDPSRGIHVDAYDPSKDAEQTVRYDEIDLDRYLFAYYLPFVRAIDFGESTDSQADSDVIEAASFGPVGLTVGLLRPIAELTREYLGHQNMSGYAQRIQEILAEQAPSQNLDTAFPDGSVIATRWIEAIQARDVWTEP